MNYKYFLYVAIFSIAILMISNTVAVKLVQFGPFIFAGAILIFPISYIFGDILTEVYGYSATRKVIWAGFAALILMSAGYVLVQHLPSPVFWQNQEAYEAILGFAPRIVAASILAYFIGEFANSFVMSRMKVMTGGKMLWSRTIGSTLVGQGLDSIVFGVVAFWGTVPIAALGTIIVSGYLFKVLYEVAATPLTYLIVDKLKQAEGIDVYDRNTNYSPFTFDS